MMRPFTLDPILENDTHELATLPLSTLRLMDDARFPWVILVPMQPNLVELIDLSAKDQAQLIKEIALVSEKIKTLYNPRKLNVAALGNQVRQLHIHIIARFENDTAWPGPVWGFGEREMMSESLVESVRKKWNHSAKN